APSLPSERRSTGRTARRRPPPPLPRTSARVSHTPGPHVKRRPAAVPRVQLWSQGHQEHCDQRVTYNAPTMKGRYKQPYRDHRYETSTLEPAFEDRFREPP